MGFPLGVAGHSPLIPERIPPAGEMTPADVCRIADKWTVDVRLMEKLAQGAQELPYPIQIISGYRTPAQQDELRREGRPAAANDRSTHLSCPATGADVWPVGVTVVPAVKAAIGAAMSRQGLRWGGGSTPDPNTGIPSDWNHFDLGPRK